MLTDHETACLWRGVSGFVGSIKKAAPPLMTSVPATHFKVPELSLVVLIGPSGSGKSTLRAGLFKPTEILSSDFCRGLVSDDENSQAATNDAFDVLHYIAGKRLAAGG